MLLAIDTSTQWASLALYHENGVQVETSWQAGLNQTVTLLPQVERLLALAAIRPADLTAVAVAIGPGAFNALRVGLSAAKGLAYALQIPLLGIPTLDAIAYAYHDQGGLIRPILSAGRAEVNTALYQARADHPLKRLELYRRVKLAELTPDTSHRTLFCGELKESDYDYLRRTWGRQATFVSSPAAGVRRAGFLAELAWQRLARGESDDPVTLQPIYLRPPV